MERKALSQYQRISLDQLLESQDVFTLFEVPAGAAKADQL
jgi:hypothetical protein